ncbi:MAG: TetR/AcrR family transcriptional regulator [Clostridium sp.]|nr:TetR/AcrR family transcriptional regulator [Clostridium sp.]
MARPAKKTPKQWKKEILDAALELFLSKGYEETSVSDIMEAVGGAKGMFYRCFPSKEELMHALGDQMFFENNPFEAVRKRTDLNGLQKIRELLTLNQADTARSRINVQAIAILKDPRILAAAIEENRRILTPLWFELLEEGRRDGSVKTEYARDLSELLPLINFWLMPSVFPASAEEIRHKYRFIVEMLAAMGLPLTDNELTGIAEKFLADISEKEENQP